jgi:Zinc knuckle
VLENEYTTGSEEDHRTKYPKDIADADARLGTYRPIVTAGSEKTSSSVDNRSNKSGHVERQLGLTQGGRDRKIVCYKCQKEGHMAKDCAEADSRNEINKHLIQILGVHSISTRRLAPPAGSSLLDHCQKPSLAKNLTILPLLLMRKPWRTPTISCRKLRMSLFKTKIGTMTIPSHLVRLKLSNHAVETSSFQF